MPGGAEALVHTRETIENAIRSDPNCGVWATATVDFQTAFPSLLREPLTLHLVQGFPSCNHGRSGAKTTVGLFFCPRVKSIGRDEAPNKGTPWRPFNVDVLLLTSLRRPLQT